MYFLPGLLPWWVFRVWGSFIWPNAQAPKWDTDMPRVQAVMRLCCVEGAGPGVWEGSGVSMGTATPGGDRLECGHLGLPQAGSKERRKPWPRHLSQPPCLPATRVRRVCSGGLPSSPLGLGAPIIVYPVPLKEPSWKPEGAQVQVLMALNRSSSQDANLSPPFSLWQ